VPALAVTLYGAIWPCVAGFDVGRRSTVRPRWRAWPIASGRFVDQACELRLDPLRRLNAGRLGHLVLAAWSLRGNPKSDSRTAAVLADAHAYPPRQGGDSLDLRAHDRSGHNLHTERSRWLVRIAPHPVCGRGTKPRGRLRVGLSPMHPTRSHLTQSQLGQFQRP
jgi:hypothetical protein